MNWNKFEKFCLLQHSKVFNHKVWHWNTIPYEHLEKSGYVHQFNSHRINIQKKVNEFGLDGLAYDQETDTYHGIQCKYWNSNDYITAKDLGTFYQVIYNRLNKKNIKSKGFLYYTCRLQLDVRQDLFNQNIIVPIYCNKVKF
jgi:hypothetical protein